jgi:hypothetical protein
LDNAKVWRLDVNALDCYDPVYGAWRLRGADVTTIPTLEESETRSILPTSIAATSTVLIGASNLVQRISGLSLVFSGAVAASDTDYWQIELQRIRANGTAVRIATQWTKLTGSPTWKGGIQIDAYTAWTFDSAVWPETLRYLRKGDILRLVFTKTGAPAALTDGCVAIRYEPNAVAPIRDTFSRPDSTTSLGISDSGHTWQVLRTASGASVFGIKDGGAALETGSGTNRDAVVIDTGVYDCTINAIWLEVTNAGFGLRMSDGVGVNPSGYLIYNDRIYRSDAGTLTGILVFSGGTFVIGDEITIVLSGPSITVYKNGIDQGSVYADLTYRTTKHGLRCAGSVALNTRVWDDFMVAY